MASDIEPISSLKRAAELVDRVRERRSPIFITQNGRAAAVLQDVDSFQEQKEAFAMLKLCLDGEKAIDEGRSSSLAEFRKRRKQRASRLRKSEG
jgi:prevent-host-death family protein